MTAQEIITTHDDGDDRQTYWANRIQGHMQKSIEDIIQAGLALIAAKDELDHGQFTTMLKDRLQMHIRTAERLMDIARCPILSDPTHGSHLPLSMRTLSELATLKPKLLEEKIADGTINPNMERNDAYKLKPVSRGLRHAARMNAKHKAKMAPINRLKEENEEHIRQIADLDERLANAEQDNGCLNLANDPVEYIVGEIIDRAGEDKAKAIATAILQRYKKKPGRPKKVAR